MKIKALLPPASFSHLLSFDFDDTLFDPLYPGHVPALFFEKMVEWRERYGVLWGINTGRDYEYLKSGYLEQVNAPFAPDFSITMERNIHLPDEHQYLRPLKSWNRRCEEDHKTIFFRLKGPLEQLMEDIQSSFPQVIWWRQVSDPYSIEVEDPSDLDSVSAFIDEWIVNYPDLSTQRAGPYLRFCHRDYNKGTALEEVMRLFGIAPRFAFITGDGHNDMDAMKHVRGSMCACPANAALPVKELVKSKGGYVSIHARVPAMIDILENAIFPWLNQKKDGYFQSI